MVTVRGETAKAGVGPMPVVEVDPSSDADAGLRVRFKGMEIHVFVLEAAPEAFDKHISSQRPRSSMEMRMPLSCRTLVKVKLVNWLPWSVLKISGLPYFAKASSRAQTQKSASMVLDSL